MNDVQTTLLGRLRSFRKEDRGATALMVAVILVVLIGIAALAIDIGYAMLTRTQLQNVADSAALAATRNLGHIYEGLSVEDQRQFVATPQDLKPAANLIAQENEAGGSPIAINYDDIIVGRWNSVSRLLTPTMSTPDAIRVTARRDASANGPISTFFARIFDIDTIPLTATATAALTSQRAGKAYFPVGISKYRFTTSYCSEGIKLYPTGDPASCAGWHTFYEDPSNAATLKRVLQALKDRYYPVPEVVAGVSRFIFTGGTLSSVFNNMANLFHSMKGLNDGEYDHDENPDTWTTTVVVYDSNDCKNPHGPMLIVGFAEIQVIRILSTPDKIIEAVITCDFVGPGRGGGDPYGRKGAVPGLVQ